VGKHFLLEDFPGVLDTFLFGDAWPRTTSSDEIQSDVLFLDYEGFIK
jgi:hypothetical protein